MKNFESDLIWLNEAYSQSTWDHLEIACFLPGFSKNEVYVSRRENWDTKFEIIDNPQVDSMYDIARTWPKNKSPLWYINYAIYVHCPHLNRELHLKKCGEIFVKRLEKDKKKFIEDYPYIFNAIAGYLKKSESTDDVMRNNTPSEIGRKGADKTNSHHEKAKIAAIEYVKVLLNHNPAMPMKEIKEKISEYFCLKRISRKNGNSYALSTIGKWISPFVPKENKKGGRPKNNNDY